MASNNPTARTAAQDGVVLTNPTTPGTTTGGGGSSSSSSSAFSGIDNPEALAILMGLIQQMASGGTDNQKAQRAERNNQIQSARGTLSDYTKTKAFSDAADLMAQNLRQSMEKNMPAISKSIQGAGTSASSMQGLLSQKLAVESAQAAGAMGADQAKSYGAISAQLQGVLEALTRIDPSIEESLIKALDLTKVQRQSQSQSQITNPTVSTTAGGGGTYYQPVNQDGSITDSDYRGAVNQALAPVSQPQGYGYAVNSSGNGTQWSGGQEQSIYVQPTIQPQSFLDQQYEEGWGYGD